MVREGFERGLMDWKEFLKPDWRKVVVFVILVLILPIPSMSGFSCYGCSEIKPIYPQQMKTSSYPPPVNNSDCHDVRPCYPYLSYLPVLGAFWNFSMFLMNLRDFENNRAYFEVVLYPLILFLSSIIISYLLSCWIYDKLRKKKEDYVHIKDVNMVMGQLEKWGKKKKK